MKIVVLGGGISSERHVSLVSAVSICSALRSIGHQAVFADLYLGIEDEDVNLETLFDREDGNCPHAAIGHEEPDLAAVRSGRKDQSPSRLGKNVLDLCAKADIVFLALHGKDGEDGKIQAALDLLGIPYTASGMLGSALAMDKAFTKKVLRSEGIPVVPETDHAPCVVKEIHGGSSIGTWLCPTEEERERAMKSAREDVMVEKLISGREFTVPVLGGRALSVIEIVPPDKTGTFDYISKYQSGSESAREICPAEIPEEWAEEMKNLAEQVCSALGLEVCARIDFMRQEDGQVFCLEANTIPGMTPNSLFPKAAKVDGLDFPELCQKIVELSLEKNRT